MNKSTFYITTSIAYVNAKPHIGFALESIQADVLARYHRLKGKEVFFLTGTDEHGSKMYQTANNLGIEVQALADQNAEKFKELKELLNLSSTDFIRTSSERHKKGAQKLWKKLMEAGDIYKSSYQGYYCVGCENFITEKDLVDGKCPNHLKEPEFLKEENYFFRLSKYSKEIGEKIESGELKVLPESRRNEILNVIKEEGLKDISFSRPKKVLGWGVPVPEDPEQIMYVWCDALSNYITALDYEGESELYKKFWPADAHLIGKDIIRFHAGVWIGMLLSAKVPLPKAIYVHGFITSNGQKMSKSLGNVVDPAEMVPKYGTDALRYYLLREIPTGDDGDFNEERFKALYNSDLANNLGNLLNRVTAMAEKYKGQRAENKRTCDMRTCDEGTNAQARSDSRQEIGSVQIKEIEREYKKAVESFDLKKALEEVFKVVDAANVYVDQKKPWDLAKNQKTEELRTVIFDLLIMLKFIAELLFPFLPQTAEKIGAQLGIDIVKSGDIMEFNIKKGDALFPRME